MRNKNIHTLLVLLLLSGIIYYLAISLTAKKEIKTETTFSIGKTEQNYKKGKDSLITKTKSFHTAAKLERSSKDSSYNFSKSDSLYTISINIKPEADDSLSLEYFLELTTKELVRIDTIYQSRVDTLKTKETIYEKASQSFFNTFLFGAITTALVIILLHQFIQ